MLFLSSLAPPPPSLFIKLTGDTNAELPVGWAELIPPTALAPAPAPVPLGMATGGVSPLKKASRREVGRAGSVVSVTFGNVTDKLGTTFAGFDPHSGLIDDCGSDLDSAATLPPGVPKCVSTMEFNSGSSEGPAKVTCS